MNSSTKADTLRILLIGLGDAFAPSVERALIAKERIRRCAVATTRRGGLADMLPWAGFAMCEKEHS